jgi:hypothetical protein
VVAVVVVVVGEVISSTNPTFLDTYPVAVEAVEADGLR